MANLDFLLLSMLASLDAFAAASIRYDQSQFGDYNVQIHLKNIELFAILDEGVLNSEYDYDYAELTEKPSGQVQANSTTAKPTTSNPIMGSINSSAAIITNQLLASPEPLNVTDDGVKLNRKCGAGYYRDNFGRCRRLRKPHLPAIGSNLNERKANNKS